MEYYKALLAELTASAKKHFTDQLIGVYLHGSAVMGCFQPEKSDLDLILIVDGELSDIQKLSFMKDLVSLNRHAPEKGIEMSIVQRKYCSPFCYPTPFELHFSNMHLEWFLRDPEDYIRKMKGADRDLAAHFTILRAFGEVLYGASIGQIFAAVPREAYLDSILRDISDAKEEILENPVYLILNLCRVDAYLQDNLICSKKSGGEWGLAQLPSRYHGLISSALESYRAGTSLNPDPLCAAAFADFMTGRIAQHISSASND